MNREEAVDFIYDEAWMLDEGQYHDWLNLWLPDAVYWMPLNWNQQDPINETSLLYEDNFMLRLRIERQLGYKHAKYLTGIEAVASLDGIGAGKGGFWEDRVDYEWYAGI